MKKKIGLVLSVGVIVAVMGAFLVGPALAQTPAPATPAAPAAPSTPAAPQGVAPRVSAGYEALATLLGMSVQDINTARQNGQTLSDIGKSKGVTDQQMIDALVSARKTAIDQALTNGSITQAQHDWLLQAAQDMAQLQVTNPFPLGRGGRFMLGAGPLGGNGPMMGGERGFGFRGFGYNRNDDNNGGRGFNSYRFQGMPGRGRNGFGNGFNFNFGRGGRFNNQNQSATPAAPSVTPSGSSGA